MKKAIVFILLFALAFTSLGANAETITEIKEPGKTAAPAAQPITVASVFQAADEANKDVKNYDLTCVSDMKIKMGKESVASTMTMKFSVITDPMKIKGTMTTKEGKKTIKYTIYMRTVGNQLEMYLTDGKSVELQSEPLTEADSQTGKFLFDIYKSALSSKYAGKKKVNGKLCHVITLQVADKSLTNLLGDTQDMMSGIEAETPGSAASVGVAIPVTYSFDAKTYQLVRADVDMSKYMKKYFEMLLGEYTNEIKLSIQKFSFSYTFSNYNKVKDFDIPASVIAKAR